MTRDEWCVPFSAFCYPCDPREFFRRASREVRDRLVPPRCDPTATPPLCATVIRPRPKRVRPPRATTRLQWTKEGTFNWYSTCGRYHIWVQARPRDDGAWYGAEIVATEKWLTDSSTFREAKELCQEHADKAGAP